MMDIMTTTTTTMREEEEDKGERQLQDEDSNEEYYFDDYFRSSSRRASCAMGAAIRNRNRNLIGSTDYNDNNPYEHNNNYALYCMVDQTSCTVGYNDDGYELCVTSTCDDSSDGRTKECTCDYATYGGTECTSCEICVSGGHDVYYYSFTAFTVNCTHRPGEFTEDGVEIVYSTIQETCPPSGSSVPNIPTIITISVVLLVAVLYIQHVAWKKYHNQPQPQEQETVVSTMTQYEQTNKDGILKIG
jgi:hypothetical protein